MTHYPVPQWVPASTPGPSYVGPRKGTRMTRWGVFLGIVSVVAGFLLPIPILALVFSIVGLCRGTDIPGRAVVGIVFGWSGLMFWGAAIAIAIWSMHVNYA